MSPAVKLVNAVMAPAKFVPFGPQCVEPQKWVAFECRYAPKLFATACSAKKA